MGRGRLWRWQIPDAGGAEWRTYDAYMPVTAEHPNATERFRRAAGAANPEYTDLGMWNVYLNPDMPRAAGEPEERGVCGGEDCTVDQGLAQTIAEFKTPALRDLEDSAPYFHNGSALTFNDVVGHYIRRSALARAGRTAQCAAGVRGMSISQDDLRRWWRF